MPIWLRKLTFNYIDDFYVKEREEFEKSIGKEQLTENSDFKKVAKITPPDFVSKVKKAKK